MNQPNFEKWSEMAKKVQEPFQAIAELNIKTLQNISYLKPEDLTQIRNPEQLLEKQMHLAMENGQKALDYMQKSMQIFEQALQGVVRESKKSTEGVFREARKGTEGVVRETRKGAEAVYSESKKGAEGVLRESKKAVKVGTKKPAKAKK